VDDPVRVRVSSSSKELIAEPLSIIALTTEVFRSVPQMLASFRSVMPLERSR
jgi:hypothetical protein